MKRHEFEVILVRPDSEMSDTGEGLLHFRPVRDEYIGA